MKFKKNKKQKKKTKQNKFIYFRLPKVYLGPTKPWVYTIETHVPLSIPQLFHQVSTQIPSPGPWALSLSHTPSTT